MAQPVVQVVGQVPELPNLQAEIAAQGPAVIAAPVPKVAAMALVAEATAAKAAVPTSAEAADAPSTAQSTSNWRN